jgi:hypothetical protein
LLTKVGLAAVPELIVMAGATGGVMPRTSEPLVSISALPLVVLALVIELFAVVTADGTAPV